MIDEIIGVIPLVLVVAFIMLIVTWLKDRSVGPVERMKQAVGGVVMLLVALMVVFAFVGGGGDGPQPPDPPEPVETYDVSFYVASDSAGYGTVSISSLQEVPEGTAATVAQTISIGDMGQCTATPAADTAQYGYAFSHWTGADDADTPAPTSITADTSYYAHFTMSAHSWDPSLFTFSVADGEATVTGWATAEPEAGYDLWFPETDSQGHPVTAIGGSSDSSYVSPWTGAATVRADSVVTVGEYAFKRCTMTSVTLPSATRIDDNAFYTCISLASVSLPSATSIGTSAFLSCKSLPSISLPAATSINNTAFAYCTSLASVSLPSATSIDFNAFFNCTGIEAVTFGPLTTVASATFPAWTFYDTNGTTVLDKTVAANLANSTFEGTASALIKVASGAKSLSPQMQERATELAAENSLKASMLADLDPELAGMDSSDVARMTVEQIRGLTSEDVQALKQAVREAGSAEEGSPRRWTTQG